MEWHLYLETLARVPEIVEASLLTLELVAFSLALGFALAVPVALMRLSRSRLLAAPAYGFVFFFRGTPLLVQIYLVYYGLGQFTWLTESPVWTVLREAYWCAIISFVLNTAAYQAEVLRGAMLAVPRGEIEAARACGMSGFLLFRRIVAPRAIGLGLPALGNEVILMLKASALVSTITMLDLMGMTRLIYARTFAIELFFYAGVVYLVINFAFTRAWRALERRLNRYLEATPVAVARAQSAGAAAE